MPLHETNDLNMPSPLPGLGLLAIYTGAEVGINPLAKQARMQIERVYRYPNVLYIFSSVYLAQLTGYDSSRFLNALRYSEIIYCLFVWHTHRINA